MKYKQLSAGEQPITLAEARLHLRSINTDSDAEIMQMVAASTRAAEHYTGRSLALNTWALKLDAFPAGRIQLNHPPIVSITSISYIDTGGSTIVLSPSLYTLDSHSEPGYVRPVFGAAWPATRATENAVTITYTAGYGIDCHDDAKHWIKAHLGTLDLYREDIAEGTTSSIGFDRLLSRLRLYQ